jgi:hypothetical protein
MPDIDLTGFSIKSATVRRLGELVLVLADGSEIPLGPLPEDEVPASVRINDIDLPVVRSNA